MIDAATHVRDVVVEGDHVVGPLNETDCLRLRAQIVARGETAPPDARGARRS